LVSPGGRHRGQQPDNVLVARSARRGARLIARCGSSQRLSLPPWAPLNALPTAAPERGVARAGSGPTLEPDRHPVLHRPAQGPSGFDSGRAFWSRPVSISPRCARQAGSPPLDVILPEAGSHGGDSVIGWSRVNEYDAAGHAMGKQRGARLGMDEFSSSASTRCGRRTR